MKFEFNSPSGFRLGLTYQVRIMNLASIAFKKSTFQKKSHLNALGSNLTLTISKSQGHRPSGEEDF